MIVYIVGLWQIHLLGNRMIAMSNLQFYKYTINVIENMKGQSRSGQSRVIGNIGHTIHRTKTNKTYHTTQKLKGKMSNTDPTKHRVRPYVFVKSKQFLLLIRHPPSYSYIYIYATSEKPVNDQSYAVLDRYGITIL